jgi:hypothetical protein
MELRGVPGQGARELSPGEAERTPGSAPSPGEVALGSLGSAGAAGTPGAATPAGTPAGGPQAAGTRPSTGDDRVDEAVARLADLAELPVAEHPGVFEYVHERLTEALGELDVRDPAGPGGPGGTGGAGGHVPGPRAPGG